MTRHKQQEALVRNGPFKAAVVQAAPVWLDLAASTDKAISLIENAASQGAKIVAFGESWLPGYPMWIWVTSPFNSMPMNMRLRANAPEVPGPAVAAICDAARKNDIYVSMGMTERDGGSLYCTQVFIDNHGEIIGKRRKLKPTHAERMMWGEGGGNDLFVMDTDVGKLGGLNCWENIQPLTKMAMYSMGEQLHVMAWPWFCINPQVAPALGYDSAVATTVSYALEGQCYVLAATSVMTQEIKDQFCDSPDKDFFITVGGGGAMIVGPDSRILTPRLPEDQEGVLVAEIDPMAIEISKIVADPVGHYGRGDVVSLNFNPNGRPIVVTSPTPAVDRAEVVDRVAVVDSRTEPAGAPA
jgi:nitrilase